MYIGASSKFRKVSIMGLVVRVKVAWSIGKGNQASRRGDWATAIYHYRSARDSAIAGGVLGDALGAGLLLAGELREAGDITSAVAEYGSVIDRCREVDAFAFGGRRFRASEVEVEAIEELIDIANVRRDQAMVQQRLEQLVESAVYHHDRRLGSSAMARLGDACRELGNHASAQQWYQRALGEFADLGDVKGQAETYRSWGRSVQLSGNQQEALVLFRKALSHYQLSGDLPNQANQHGQLGDVRCALGDLPGAREEYEMARNLFRRTGDADGEARALRLILRLGRN